MPRISTDNYDTVASWNGSQDLFIVEQPDGTKVATPAMVKQFMEAGDFEATGEVKDGHGNILKDMAKSADVNTALEGKQDTLTFDNVPTASSNNPVKSGGVYTALNNVETISGHGSYGCGYTAYKFGKVVVLLVNGITNSTTGISMQLFTLPTGWRPKNFMRVIGSTLVASLNGTNLVGFNIYSNGICETYSYTAFTNGLFSCAYMVD
jgi:hypothetical protein